jgi:nucleoside-diphosphate-sugar epimerase
MRIADESRRSFPRALSSNAVKVLITGCSGYVGHQIASRFASADWDVVGSSRRPFSLDGVDVVTGDHLDADFVASIVRRCDVVLHFAARTRGHDAECFHRNNEAVTSLFCRVARRLGKRFVQISSDQAVYQTGFYGKSKRACEEIVAHEGADYVVLRLSAVLGRYAPEMASTFSKIIMRLHRSRCIVVPGSCQFPIAPIWIGDIERVLRQFLELPRMPDDVFELCGDVLKLESMIDLFEQQLGVRRRRLRLPLRPLQSVARVLKPHSVFARLPLDALLDLGVPVKVSHEKLTQAIGFEPTEMARAVPQIEGFPA